MSPLYELSHFSLKLSFFSELGIHMKEEFKIMIE